MSEILQRNPKLLKENPFNPRGGVDSESPEMLELVNSILSHGVIEPLLITPEDFVIVGHRRRIAASKAGLETVPCIVKDWDVAAQIEVMLIENMQRADLNPIQEAKGFATLVKLHRNEKLIAKKLGISFDKLKNRLSLLSLNEEVQSLIATGELGIGVALELLKVEKKDQPKTARAAIKWGLSKQQTATIVSRQQNQETPTTRKLRADQETVAWAIDQIIRVQERLNALKTSDQTQDIQQHLNSSKNNLRTVVDLLMKEAKKFSKNIPSQETRNRSSLLNNEQ